MNPDQENQTTEVETEIPSSETLPTSEESSEEEGPQFEEPDFAAITDFVDGVGEEEVPLVAAAAEEEPEAPEQEVALEDEAPVAEPSESAEPVEEEPETPVEEVVEPEPEVQPEPEPEPVKLATKEELEAMYTEHREKTLPQLEEIFTLSDEEAAALDEQPSKVLPKLAAQLQYDVTLSAYNAVLAALPSVLGTLNKANDLATQAHGQFMDAWPELNKRASEPVVKAAIQAFRSANPRATLEETIKGAGVMASIQLGLDPTGKAASGKVVPKPKPKVMPPKPVAPTGQSPVPPVSGKEEVNEFAELAEVFLQEMS